ncbi:2-isopropylmalate synthase [Verrucomicrobiaceae bacterium R5-34]|uniref:2-isopropylmalate synthase n=1 Tax=Oceaniferula flava TaxID=2800421 RepID=A0AAE2SG53_9BACT|nr:2-isopropylmalate synthase [Oceaniferula flavus]MBK1829882.1 2-isopropylmalate synthase [Verrucomicrobiaceae bacterium R5-34]MBK1856352.1 2-isopropylmalate synthase [Oceaniferula flavus]MBM1137659.1 2-isopropylmalate synthase [Oceaniferula flavus]
MKPDSIQKYRAFPAVDLKDRTWPDRVIDHSPIWCSVDLRDGNQALPQPMSIEEKLEFFELLCRVGFKQIEIGFPSAADTEFNFCRRLIEENRIPEDVTIQILVQTREHLIRRSFEAINGAKRAIVHIYNSTSPLQRRVTFGDASREEIRDLAIEGTKLVKELVPTVPDTEIVLQYSPESFSDTELDFALECCNEVIEIWQPTPEKKMVINLPDTVQWTTPNIHADMIEWMGRHLNRRDSIDISLHTHNDRGTGTAATELGLMAGADRVEGTLFGNGERTGNLDIINVALNMNSHGIETGLDFSNINELRAVYERVTRMTVGERHPYAGELVFTAFSGSHQDAIKKGLDRRNRELKEQDDLAWGVPYLTIDPQDIGRSYEAIIRINSQSGKGGVAWVLEREHGLELPKTMHPQVGKRIYDMADEQGRELNIDEIREAFYQYFVNVDQPLAVSDYELVHHTVEKGLVDCTASITVNGEEKKIEGQGNGPINAFTHALENAGLKNFQLTDYRSHAVRGGSDANAAAYVQLRHDDGRILWGCGIDASIEMAGLKALVCAANLFSETSS